MEIIEYYMTTYSTCIACMHVITEQLHKFHHCTCKINNYDRCVQFRPWTGLLRLTFSKLEIAD